MTFADLDNAFDTIMAAAEHVDGGGEDIKMEVMKLRTNLTSGLRVGVSATT